MNTATFPPLNVAAFPGVELVRTYKLSFSFWMSITFGPAGCGGAGCWCAATAIDNDPATSRLPNRVVRFMISPRCVFKREA
jgi:hypothetical protein